MDEDPAGCQSWILRKKNKQKQNNNNNNNNNKKTKTRSSKTTARLITMCIVFNIFLNNFSAGHTSLLRSTDVTVAHYTFHSNPFSAFRTALPHHS